MADEKTIERAALSFYQLLGAPLYALIEAESYAADATAQFIERVGFETAQSTPDQPLADMGKLRTISFKQERRDSEGRAASYKVEVPLLSILPIPAMQIREAELEFFVKIVDMVLEDRPKRRQNGKGASDPAPKDDREATVPGLIADSKRIDFKTMMGRGQVSGTPTSQSAFDMQVHVKIKVAQADIPAGLSRLFNLMEQSISSTLLSEDPETP
jgi:hypothetical protein